MRTNINVQELVVEALMTENIDNIYHAAMLDPHTAAELDLTQISVLMDDLLAAQADWNPEWVRPNHLRVKNIPAGGSSSAARKHVETAS